MKATPMTAPAVTQGVKLPASCCMRSAGNHQASYDAAIRENPANAPITPAYQSETGADTSQSGRQARLLVSFSKYWARGRTLKVLFLKNPPASLTAPIVEAARKWLPHINLKFEFVTDGASDIRIGFNEHLNWSAIGTDTLLAGPDEATMEFNLKELYTADLKPMPELTRIVLHEFGHALGAVHEHQHPQANIPWNEPLLRSLLSQTGLSDEEINTNFFDRYEAADFHHSAYDRDSVMHFDIPNGLTLGDFEIINVGKTLSSNDIAVMGAIYADRGNSKFETL
ncbi:zinc-dependent metalloprotease [Pseudomonas syringae pv. syringae PD2774]|uniref:matrixin family metalloprotease n=1 Tax=Pseudomonas syringae TaxID=317 RepID=UPI000736DFE7|nr:matrixin family metalloprotease [Pseudomonas syringae]KTB90745.1 zinc-dependent metalloprotease [Pseudomonas syringae pv. syringae PD2774]